MTFSTNGKVLSFIITSSILCILFAFISSILGSSWFFLFLLSFCLLPLFIYMYREKNAHIFDEVNCRSPCSGRVLALTNSNSHMEILFSCGIFDLYQKNSPVNGLIKNILHHDLQHKDNPGGVVFEIENKLGSFILEIFHKTSARPSIEIFVEKGQEILQGSMLCFVEFGSMIKLTIPFTAECLVHRDAEVSCGVHTIVR